MFGIDSSEFLLIAVVALLVIGPKDLPRVMRLVGGWVGRGRAMTRHLRSGFDTMMREAELEEMQKQWAKQNADIMAATHVAPVPPYGYDTPVTPNIYGMPVVEPGALSEVAHTVTDRHPRESGDDGGSGGGDGATVMTGPQPPAHALVHEPAIPLEPAPAPPAP